jgi:hypothetical protein
MRYFDRCYRKILGVARNGSPLTFIGNVGHERIAGLPGGEKDRLLLLVAQDQGTRVKMELLRRLHGNSDSGHGTEQGRTVGALLDAAALRRQQRED